LSPTNESAARSSFPVSERQPLQNFAVIIFLLLAVMGSSCSAGEETLEIRIKDTTFVVEVADSQEERSRGLMFRTSLPDNRGMLFVFPYDQRLSFWMKNTEIPLSLAYISKDGTIKEIHDLVPHNEQPVQSRHSVRYALELNRGAFEQAGIEVGDRVEGLP